MWPRRRYQHLLAWVSPFERPMSEKVEGRKYRLESRNFIFPPSSPLFVCLVLGASQSTVGQIMVDETHAEWQIRWTQIQRRDKNSFARQLSGLLISLRVCYCWIGAPGDVKWFLVKVLFLLSNWFFLWRMFELARLGGSQLSPLSSPCFNSGRQCSFSSIFY